MKRRRVTVTTPWGDIYKGFIVKATHELHLGGKPEKVYMIETSDGRRSARASWIGDGR